MALRYDFEETWNSSDTNYDEDYEDLDPVDELAHKRKVRRLLEDRLERKRLKDELEDELEGEFDWDDNL